MKKQVNFLSCHRQWLILVVAIIYFAGSCSPAHTPRTGIKTKPGVVANDSMVRIKKLLVLTYGNTSSKIIATNIHLALQDKMRQNGAITDFEFRTQPGDTSFTTEINELPVGGYEGYLFLSPLHTASINFTKAKTGALPVYVGTGFMTRTGYASAYEESYNVELFAAGNKLLYSGEMNVHMNPSRKFQYKNLIAKLIIELNKMNIRLW